MFKITDLMIAVVLIGLFTVVSVTIIANWSTLYGTEYNTPEYANLTMFDRLNETNQLANEINLGATNASQRSGSFDVLGDFFSQGYGTLKLMSSSISTARNLTQEGIMRSGLGDVSGYFNLAIGAIIVIIIAGIILSVLLKERI